MDKRIKETLSSVFKVSVEEINEAATPYSIKNWDSLNHIKMIIALEEEFSIEFDQPEIEAMISFDIIKATIFAYIN